MITIDAILLDVEGTTTDIAFVKSVLFPYAHERMASFIEQHLPPASPAVLEPSRSPVSQEVQHCLDAVHYTIAEETGVTITTEQAIEALLHWIERDRKHTALKTLQGLIWESGYRNGDFQGHVYGDVLPALKAWQASGQRIAIFSSGSVRAQQLLFNYSTAGDLTPYLSGYFDTTTGPKHESGSYQAIAKALNVAPERICFCSDVLAELDAAHAAGLQPLQMQRPGNAVATASHPTVESFETVRF